LCELNGPSIRVGEDLTYDNPEFAMLDRLSDLVAG